jgi:hypothetical protein
LTEITPDRSGFIRGLEPLVATAADPADQLFNGNQLDYW